MHTVNEVARLANISVRTLHHYDAIGLLKPAYIGDNRYRYYGEAELLRLQQILFYREFGISLNEIADLLEQPDFDQVATLREHRERLEIEVQSYRQLIGTIDRTIARLTGVNTMKNSDLYKGFTPEKQMAYEDWLVDRYGPEMKANIDNAKQHLEGRTPTQRENQMMELAELEGALAERMRAGVTANSVALDDLLTRHRAWVSQMWGRPCASEDYAGLAETYLSHPDFEARYETIAEGFTAYLTSAMKAYAERCEPS